MTPLLAGISAIITFALFTVTPPAVRIMNRATCNKMTQILEKALHLRKLEGFTELTLWHIVVADQLANQIK